MIPLTTFNKYGTRIAARASMEIDDTLPLPPPSGAPAPSPASRDPWTGEGAGAPPSTSELFRFGEETLLKLQNPVGDDFGTLVISGSAGKVPVTVASELPPEAAPLSLEQKIDLLLETVLRLEQRIGSIDATLARLMAR